MFDLDNAPTVEQFVKQNGCNKLWLCPHLVSNGKISNPSWLSGIECSPGTIPEEVKYRKVRKHWKENERYYIIWYHDDDRHFTTDWEL